MQLISLNLSVLLLLVAFLVPVSPPTINREMKAFEIRIHPSKRPAYINQKAPSSLKRLPGQSLLIFIQHPSHLLHYPLRFSPFGRSHSGIYSIFCMGDRACPRAGLSTGPSPLPERILNPQPRQHLTEPLHCPPTLQTIPSSKLSVVHIYVHLTGQMPIPSHFHHPRQRGIVVRISRQVEHHRIPPKGIVLIRPIPICQKFSHNHHLQGTKWAVSQPHKVSNPSLPAFALLSSLPNMSYIHSCVGS